MLPSFSQSPPLPTTNFLCPLALLAWPLGPGFNLSVSYFIHRKKWPILHRFIIGWRLNLHHKYGDQWILQIIMQMTKMPWGCQLADWSLSTLFLFSLSSSIHVRLSLRSFHLSFLFPLPIHMPMLNYFNSLLMILTLALLSVLQKQSLCLCLSFLTSNSKLLMVYILTENAQSPPLAWNL